MMIAFRTNAAKYGPQYVFKFDAYKHQSKNPLAAVNPRETEDDTRSLYPGLSLTGWSQDRQNYWSKQPMDNDLQPFSKYFETF